MLRFGVARPKSLDPQVSISLRIPASVLASYQAQGPDWRDRMRSKISDEAVTNALMLKSTGEGLIKAFEEAKGKGPGSYTVVEGPIFGSRIEATANPGETIRLDDRRTLTNHSPQPVHVMGGLSLGPIKRKPGSLLKKGK